MALKPHFQIPLEEDRYCGQSGGWMICPCVSVAIVSATRELGDQSAQSYLDDA